MAHQVNVFAENRPGRLEKLTGILAREGINIRAVTIAGQDEYGVIKLLVDDPGKARRVLEEGGFSAFLREVVAVVMQDRPGGLHEVCRALGERGINLEDAYGFVVEEGEKAVLVMEVEKIPEAEEILRRGGFVILSDSELYSL
jgi:hypothetical protein